MTSLPIVVAASLGAGILPEEMVSGEVRSGENEQFLRDAFRSFAGAAASLERSYGTLRREVERLHGELAESNAGLARSRDENRVMRQHLDRILDGLPCGVLVEKTDGAISLLNPEGRRLLRVASAAVGGEGSLAASCESFPLVPGALRELLDRARSAPGEQEQCFERRDFEGCDFDRHNAVGGVKDGPAGACWLAVRHAAVSDVGQADSEKLTSPEAEAGDDAVSIFILRDVSAEKRMVREREKLGREQALAEIVAILAHEIRNPLGSLELFASLLAGAGLSAQCRAWVEHVQAGLRTLAATVNNVLHFHSLPAPQRVPTDLGRLLDWAGGFLVPMARQAHVELCLRNRLQGVWFPAERHRLEQVLLNLVLNALRAMPGGGWVEVAGHQVRHGGCGRDRDFGQRHRSGHCSRAGGENIRAGIQHPPGRTRAGPGGVQKDCRTARGITRGHEPHRFRGLLHPDVSPAEGGVCEPIWARGEGMNRVLVVDDEAGMRAALEAHFLRRGWQVDIAGNADEALEKFRRGLHPLVVTDIRMPGADGFAVMREARAMAPHTAVILLTAFGSVPDAVTAMRGGACDYLVKPVSFERLEEAAERILAQARTQAEAAQGLAGQRFQLAAGARPGAAGGGERCRRADRSGKRYGKRVGGAADSSAEPAPRSSICGGELRGVSRDLARKRTVRLCPGCLYRSGGGQAWQLRTGESRHAAARRSGRDAAGVAAETFAGFAGAGV